MRAGLGVFLVKVEFERLQDFVRPKTNGADTVPANKKSKMDLQFDSNLNLNFQIQI